MNTKELRELDAWIAEHVFGATRALDKGYGSGRSDDKLAHTIRFTKEVGWISCPNYTTDPAAAMMVLEKCCGKIGPGSDVEICLRFGVWNVSEWRANKIEEEAGTLPLAICLFAKKLFQKDSE